MGRARALLVTVCLLWFGAANADLTSESIARGSYLAKVADCTACHTVAGGQPFAGGFPMATPMGKVFSTNITPDKVHGIGAYTEAEFKRALVAGVAKDGHNLYPAMPYPSYAKVSDQDIHDLYVFFMDGVQPLATPNIPSTIPFPLNMRWPLAIWNAIFVKKGVYVQKADHDPVWNRGAYLVQGLGHCGACHTPRSLAMNEKALDESGENYLAGAPIDGWFASDLRGDVTVGLGRWSDTDLHTFLKTGANSHATAFGGMTDVINNSSQYFTDGDLAAIAKYLKSLAGRRKLTPAQYVYEGGTTSALISRPKDSKGAALYGTYCVGCHSDSGRGAAPFLAPLAGNPNLLESDASSLINVTLNGTPNIVLAGIPSPFPMPNYRNVLSDEEIAEIATFVRSGWNNSAFPVTSKAVAKIRKQTATSGD